MLDFEYSELTIEHKAQIIRQRILDIEAGLYRASLNEKDAQAVGDESALATVFNQQRTLGVQLANARNELEALGNPPPPEPEPKAEEPKPKRRTRKKPASA